MNCITTTKNCSAPHFTLGYFPLRSNTFENVGSCPAEGTKAFGLSQSHQLVLKLSAEVRKASFFLLNNKIQNDVLKIT